MADESDAAREARVRRLARRMGWALRKVRPRAPRAGEPARFHLVDPDRNLIVAGATPLDRSMTLGDLEAFLRE